MATQIWRLLRVGSAPLRPLLWYARHPKPPRLLNLLNSRCLRQPSTQGVCDRLNHELLIEKAAEGGSSLCWVVVPIRDYSQVGYWNVQWQSLEEEKTIDIHG